jgi:DNA transposition AAA+ family ATPase
MSKLKTRIKKAAEKTPLYAMAVGMGVNPATLNRILNNDAEPKQARVISSIESWLSERGF